jgi:hypothetical protein
VRGKYSLRTVASALRPKGSNFYDEIDSRLDTTPQMLAAKKRSLEADELGEKIGKAENAFRHETIGWAEKDPAAALDFLQSLGTDGTKLISDVFQEWAQKDPDAALERAKKLPEGKDRCDILADILPAWQLKHPDQSIDQVANLSGMPDSQYEGLVFKLLEHRSAENPAAAMDYALVLADAGMRGKAVTTVMERWATKSPEEAQKWIEAQPRGDLRDAALVELIRATGQIDLAAANRLI